MPLPCIVLCRNSPSYLQPFGKNVTARHKGATGLGKGCALWKAKGARGRKCSGRCAHFEKTSFPYAGDRLQIHPQKWRRWKRSARQLNYSKATQLLNAVAEGACVFSLAGPRGHASRLGRSSAQRSCPVGEALVGMSAFVQSGLCFRAAHEMMPLFFTDHAFLAHARRVDDDQ